MFSLRCLRGLTTVLIAWVLWVPRGIADEVIRIMAANITSGNGQDYDLGHGNRIFQGLDPDITLVQEMNYLSNTPAELRDWVDENFGPGFYYFRESGGGIPNGIVSRYPILAAGEWDDDDLSDRDFVWARIDIPGEKDLWAISVHFKASSGGANETRRNNQARQLLEYIDDHIPPADYLVVGGDFNTFSRTEPCLETLSIGNQPPPPAPPGVLITAGPWPADQSGEDGTSANRSRPYDWVIPDADLEARKTPLVIGTQTFANGLVFDSRGFTPLAAVSPVLAGDSGASGMQHMAVVRAFLIPTNEPPFIVSAADSSSRETVSDPDSSVFEIVRGTSVGLSVAATDDGGESALEFTWSKTGGVASPVTFSTNGSNAAKTSTATFQAAGDYTLTVTVRDAPGLTATSSVKVRVVQTPSGLMLDPPTATLEVNASHQFSATVSDQFSQPMAAVVSWSADGGGSINSSGLFTATTAGGPHLLTARSGGLSATASVTVEPAPASVILTNLEQTYDGFPKPATATTTPGLLEIFVLYDGSPTAPISAGSYAVSATVTDPNYQGSATGTLVIAPDEWALWKNTHFNQAEQSQGLALDAADPDADGLTNLAEYALGGHPRQFTPPLPGVLDATGFSITFTRPAGLPGIRYFAEATSSLQTWSPVPLETLVEGPVETLRARETFAEDPTAPRFMRLRFERE